MPSRFASASVIAPFLGVLVLNAEATGVPPAGLYLRATGFRNEIALDLPLFFCTLFVVAPERFVICDGSAAV